MFKATIDGVTVSSKDAAKFAAAVAKLTGIAAVVNVAPVKAPDAPVTDKPVKAYVELTLDEAKLCFDRFAQWNAKQEPGFTYVEGARKRGINPWAFQKSAKSGQATETLAAYLRA